ncbi:hypothetical protein LCGC14_1315540 [marine sediment metagenome]|uniref:Uncharacterized protein n=1 Tax=marine sediment metagenome TaxID=412755 RepID=A0A0F9NNH1_9ZZZZ
MGTMTEATKQQMDNALSDKPNRVRALEFALAWALRQTHGKLYCECGKVAGDDEHQPKCKWRRAWEVWEGANTF